MNARRSLSAKGRLIGSWGVLAALSAGAAVALAATTPVGGEITVNTSGGDHDFAAVAMDADGDFIFAFERSDGSVAARRFNSLGSPKGGEVPLSALGVPGQEDPNVAMNADGNAVVAWEDGDAAEPDDIKARLIDADGGVAPGIIEVNTTTSNDQDEPQVGMAGNGDFVVVWEGEGPGDIDGVFMRRYTAAGAPKGGEVRVNQTTVDTQQSAAVAMNADGEFVVAWHGPDGSMSDRDIFARRYTASGVPVTDEFHANEHVADFGEEPGAGIDADGNFVIAWAGEEATDSDGGIYFRLFAPGGAPRTGDMPANSTTTDYQGTSDRTGVGMDPLGNFVIAWEDDSAGEPNITARRFDSLGAPLTAELHPNTTTANTQRDARAAAAGNGDFVVAWEGENGIPEVDIVARLYDVPDVTPPLLTLSGKEKQKAKRPVVVSAECDEACLATGSGKVKVKGGRAHGRDALRGGSETLKLKGKSVQLAANVPGKLKMKLKRKDAKRLAKLVEDGAKATAKVTVVAVDDSGNSAQKRKKIKLK